MVLKTKVNPLVSRGVALLLTLAILVAFTVSLPKLDFTASAPGIGVAGDHLLAEDPLGLNVKIETPKMADSLKEFRKKSKDGVAYLYLPGTDIRDEVVQGRDNDYYLRRSSLGVYYREHGCYFADYRCKMGTTPNQQQSQNIVIYGHNIYDDGTYFAQLMDYTNWQYAAQHPYIYLETMQGLQVYQIFATFYTGTDFYYILPDPNPERLQYVLDQAVERSEFDYSLTPDIGGHFLTLSTCCYKYTYPNGQVRKDQRFVVMAMQIVPENPPTYRPPVINHDKKEPF